MRLPLLFLCNTVFFEKVKGDYNEARYNLFKTPSYGPVRLGNLNSTHSIISCISTCQIEYGNTCRSVIFNKLTHTCTHATWMLTSVPPPAAGEGLLYTRHLYSHCNAVNGFRVLNSGNTYSCISYISTAKSYYNAKAHCIGLGSFLVSVKSAEKLLIVGQMAGSAEFVFVGLNDIDVEGTFVWEEDNSTITQSQASLLWRSGEPNGNPTSDEDCAILISFNQIVDGGCSELYPFICEV